MFRPKKSAVEPMTKLLPNMLLIIVVLCLPAIQFANEAAMSFAPETWQQETHETHCSTRVWFCSVVQLLH